MLVVAACTRTQPATTAVAPPPVAEPRWERFAEAQSWPLAAEPFVARGHAAGEYVVSLRVAPPNRDSYRALIAGARWPVGMTVAAFNQRRGGGEAGSVYAMTKLATGEWDYVVARPDGVIEARGALPLCARCHAEAPADSLFGASSATPESKSPALRFQSNPPAP
jgi:hypothetical protein